MTQQRNKKIVFALIVAVLVITPVAIFSLSSFSAQINPRNDSYTSYVNFTIFPTSTSPLLPGSANLTAAINETNHDPSSITMNITPGLYCNSADDNMCIWLDLSIYGNLSSSLHPTGMELRANGSLGMFAYDYECHSNDNISNVSFDAEYLNAQQTCLRNTISLHNDTRFLFFGIGSPFYHFRYSSERMSISYKPPFNQTRVFTITLSLLGLQKPVFVEYRMVVTRT